MVCPLHPIKVLNIPCQGVGAHALSIRARRRFSRRRKIGTTVCFTAHILILMIVLCAFVKGLFRVKIWGFIKRLDEYF